MVKSALAIILFAIRTLVCAGDITNIGPCLNANLTAEALSCFHIIQHQQYKIMMLYVGNVMGKDRLRPNILLGYAYIAPGDAGGAPTRIINQWRINRSVLGDVNAWMDANEANHAWNACAIVKGQKYVYFENYPFGIAHIKTEVEKENW